MNNTGKSSIASDIVLAILSNFSILLTSFIQTTILLRILSLELFGIYGIFTSSFALGLSLCMLGLDMTLTRLISKDKKKYLSYFGEMLSLISLIGIIIVILFYFFLYIASYHLYNDPNLINYLQFAIVGLFFAFFSTILISLLRGLSEIKKIAFITISSRFLGLGIAFILIIFYNLLGGIIGFIIYYFLELIFIIPSIYRVIKKYNLKIKFKISKTTINLVLRYGSAYYLLSNIVIFTFWLGLALLDRISGHEEVGIYQVGQYIFAILQQIGQSMVFVLFPKISTLSTDRARLASNLQEFLSKSIKYSFSVQFLMGLGFIIFQDVFLILFNLSENVKPTILAFIIIAPIIFGIGFILIDTILFGMSEFKILFIIRFAFFVSFFTSASAFIHIVGALGLVSALLISWIIQILIATYYLYKKYELWTSLSKTFFRSLFITSIYIISYIICIISFFMFPIPINLIIGGVLFIAALIFVFTIILDFEDRKTIFSTIKNALNY